jgi:hypothetical protein
MLRKVLVATVSLALALPAGTSAQTIGIGVRAGTLGLGGEVSVRLLDNLAVRGGIGAIPLEHSNTFSDIDYTIKPTSPLANLGVDFHPGAGGFRIGGGLLFIPNNTTLDGEYSGTVRIGNNTYSDAEVGALRGELDHGAMAPYVNAGFGRTVAPGVGFFVDLGAAFLAEPGLTLTASGQASEREEFQQDLERERQRAEEDARKYLRVLPIISIGVRFGVM